MSRTNPTVPLNVTAKELRILTDLLGYDTHYVTLRDKLNAADNEMRLATRQKNRDRKNARNQKRTTTTSQPPADAGAFLCTEVIVTTSPIEAAARRIYSITEDQPWEAATLDEEAKFRKIAESALNAAFEAAYESPVVLEYVANAISQSSGMRFDGFWSRVDELDPEDRTHALAEAQSALAAAHTATRLIEVVRRAGQ